MATCCSVLHSLFQALDLFASSKFVRYKGESEFRTATGGAVSVSIIVIFGLLFSTMGLRTVRKEIITSVTESNFEPVPSNYSFRVGTHGVMFAVSVPFVDLVAGPKYFDVVMEQVNTSNFRTVLSKKQIGL